MRTRSRGKERKGVRLSFELEMRVYSIANFFLLTTPSVFSSLDTPPQEEKNRVKDVRRKAEGEGGREKNSARLEKHP